MLLIKPSIEYLWHTPDPLKMIELAGRTCYKSEDRITDGSADKFVRMLLSKGHEAMIEHASASYRAICDRGVTHEIVRHRLFSFAQESTRYCKYSGGVTFIIPPWVAIEPGEYDCASPPAMGDFQNSADAAWFASCRDAERTYCSLIDEHRWTPQQARSVLNNSLKTEIIITGNLREWRHFFQLRCSPAAHPQAQEIANLLLADIRQRIPIVFESVST